MQVNKPQGKMKVLKSKRIHMFFQRCEFLRDALFSLLLSPHSFTAREEM